MNTELPHYAELLLCFDRASVCREDQTDVLDLFTKLAISESTTRQHTNAISITFDGYGDDPREVYEIPEIRQFISLINSRFPYWFHFLGKNDDSLKVTMLCLVELTVENIGGNARRIHLKDEKALSVVIRDLFAGMNDLYARFGLSQERNTAMTRQIRQYLDDKFGASV